MLVSQLAFIAAQLTPRSLCRRSVSSGQSPSRSHYSSLFLSSLTLKFLLVVAGTVTAMIVISVIIVAVSMLRSVRLAVQEYRHSWPGSHGAVLSEHTGEVRWPEAVGGVLHLYNSVPTLQRQALRSLPGMRWEGQPANHPHQCS